MWCGVHHQTIRNRFLKSNSNRDVSSGHLKLYILVIIRFESPYHIWAANSKQHRYIYSKTHAERCIYVALHHRQFNVCNAHTSIDRTMHIKRAPRITPPRFQNNDSYIGKTLCRARGRWKEPASLLWRACRCDRLIQMRFLLLDDFYLLYMNDSSGVPTHLVLVSNMLVRRQMYTYASLSSCLQTRISGVFFFF